MLPDPSTASIVSTYLSTLTTAHSIDEGFHSLARAVESLGFESVTYTAFPLTLRAARDSAPVFLVSRGFSGDFLKHYAEADLARNDFTIERARNGCLEVLDWGEEYRQRRLTEEQRGVVEIAHFDYGIRNAMTIPTRSDEHVIAGASIIGDDGTARFQTLKAERLELLTSLVHFFHNWIFSAPERRQRFYAAFLERLTDNELRVIQLVISGHRLKSSQDLCGLSPTRAGNILSSLYRKLGISNAHELAYLAGVHQIARML